MTIKTFKHTEMQIPLHDKQRNNCIIQQKKEKWTWLAQCQVLCLSFISFDW